MAQAVAEKKSSFKKSISKSAVKYEKLGEMLRKEGQITKDQLDEAIAMRKKIDAKLGNVLIQLGYIDEETLLTFLSRQLNYPIVNISELMINPDTTKVLTYEQAKQYLVFPIRVANDVLTLAMADPTDNEAIEETQLIVKLSIKAVVAKEKEIVNAYKKYYKISEEEYKSFFKDISAGTGAEPAVEIKEIDDIGSLVSEAADDVTVEEEEEVKDELTAEAAPIIKLVNGILTKAVKLGASDIHVEPYEKSFRVRYRQDGALYVSLNLPIQIKNALTSRFKILSNLNIAERRVPQDGRIKMRLGKNRSVDFRVSILPTLFGESIVLRILDKGNLNVDLTKLGFTVEGFAKFQKAIKQPFGLILVTGPTGSGKTTTLYSAINSLNSVDTKILTAEDPVEFNFPGINQVLVRNEVGMTFAAALKSFLRQDPEIILVGEIRDAETAEIAIKAAMTGHLVFSTLHTNDCPSTVGRIIDIGIPGYMVSSALTMVVAQRLLRRICANCIEEDPNAKKDKKFLIEAGFNEDEIDDVKISRGKGCPKCNGKGYKGRVAVYEIMEVTEEVKKAITAQVPEDQLRKTAIKAGMLTLRQDAIQKVREGTTTMDEVIKNTVMVKEALPAYLLNPDELVFESGDLIINEGNTDTNFYQLMQGSLDILKNGVKVSEVSQPGEYFGEMSALLGVPRNATIISKGKSIVKVFPGDKIKETLINYPDISTKIINTLLQRLNSAVKKIAVIGEEHEL
ncbi:MAG: type IV-A pilus assembly ATPase PilB [Nitrospinota bacterium]|nr:type IV-A pilus assembly ATPase PilB [Nitrospinota bacterium]